MAIKPNGEADFKKGEKMRSEMYITNKQKEKVSSLTVNGIKRINKLSFVDKQYSQVEFATTVIGKSTFKTKIVDIREPLYYKGHLWVLGKPRRVTETPILSRCVFLTGQNTKFKLSSLVTKTINKVLKVKVEKNIGMETYLSEIILKENILKSELKHQVRGLIDFPVIIDNAREMVEVLKVVQFAQNS